jgi:hypothetical protein
MFARLISAAKVRIDLQRPAVGGGRLLEILRAPVVEYGRGHEVLRRRRLLVRQERIHERGHGRRLTSSELQHLGRLRLDPEVECKLAVPRREQAAEHGAERGTVGERFISLAHDRHVEKRVE